MSSYEAAGVSIEAGELAVELMKSSIAKASRPEVMGGIGGFAGLFDATALKKFNRPLLATSTDGVGTKTEIARALGKYDTIGEDLVAMVVDDLIVCGAEPLFLTDYIAVGKVIPERIAEIVSGIARGCAWSRTALIGGETAEHPQLLEEDEFDLAAAATGVVEHEKLLGEHLVKAGDVAIAIESSG
ncbi:MAG: phosphoribosylformylglycinamidine cyclo-ligase, partial [Actinobacteria bacterium]|nr:phosphoribosylformylglycinamidine cyclo-ligase [Actinomycetota bacterium]